MSGFNSSPPAAAPLDVAHPVLDAVHGAAPLTMTVHALPVPGAQAQQRKLSGRWKMLIVMLMCAAPVIASYFTFYVVRPEGRRNYGELINPMRSLPDALALSPDGVATSLRALKGQWLLISVAGAACDAACEKQLYLQRQLRESLGREKDRVDRIWLITDDAPLAPALLPQVNATAVDAYALRVNASVVAQWLIPAAGQQLQDHLYLVDPAGNWMMRFPAQIDPVQAKRDLERLLRAAASWDRAGREPGGKP
ncbi:MAG: hypothetical protein WB821_06260 [Burkholderiaceae bacterium]